MMPPLPDLDISGPDLSDQTQYALTPYDGQWAATEIDGTGFGGGQPPVVYQVAEPSITDCPLGYFWLVKVI
jgi:hypothetical protein